MSIKRVEIQIESNRRFTEIASLVDKPGFLEEIESVRNWLKIEPGKYEPKIYGIRRLDELTQCYREGELTVSELCFAVQDYCLDNSLLFPKVDRVFSLSLENAGLLAVKYGKNRLYIQPIVSAIFTNAVGENDYKTTQLLHMNSSDLRQLADELDSGYSDGIQGKEEKLLAIRVDPETSMDDLADTFKYINKYKSDYFTSTHSDTLSEVKRDRDWYWKEKLGKKSAQIFRDLDDSDTTSDYTIVSKGIAKYKKLLET